MLDWYHFYLNHPGGCILAKTIWELCYWKGLVTQAYRYDNPCNIFQQFKNKITLYEHLPPKNIAELKPWDPVHVDIICPYSNYIRQQQLGGAIISNNDSLICVTMIDPATCWFGIVEIPTYNLHEFIGGNNEYINKPSAKVIQLFNNTWIFRYPCLCKVAFDNGYDFK